MGSFTGTRFELWRVAILEAFSQAADKGVFPIGLPPVEALARSLADSTASKEVREYPAVVMVTENVLQQDKAIMAAVAVKAREFSVDESLLKTAFRASSSVSELLSAIKNAERTADPAEPLTPILLHFLRAYVPVQQMLTHDIVILKEQNFRLRKLTGTYADWRSYNDARTALVAEMSTFVSEPAIFYDRYNIALSATPPEMRSAIAAKDYDDLIAGVEKSQDERMLRLGRVIETWDGPCRQHAIPSPPRFQSARRCWRRRRCRQRRRCGLSGASGSWAFGSSPTSPGGRGRSDVGIHSSCGR